VRFIVERIRHRSKFAAQPPLRLDSEPAFDHCDRLKMEAVPWNWRTLYREYTRVEYRLVVVSVDTYLFTYQGRRSWSKEGLPEIGHTFKPSSVSATCLPRTLLMLKLIRKRNIRTSRADGVRSSERPRYRCNTASCTQYQGALL
jgi:hypothetical protein